MHQVLREIGHRVFSAINELLPETNDTCLCRPCFSDSEKLIRLRQDAYNLEMNLADRLKQSGESRGLLPNDRLVSADWNTTTLHPCQGSTVSIYYITASIQLHIAESQGHLDLSVNTEPVV